MSISFSGLASGLDTSSWVESLTALKRAKVETYQAEKEKVVLSQQTLLNIKNFFNSFRSVIEKVTDSRFYTGGNADLFSQNLALSSKANILTATANSEAQEGVYNILVNNLATNTQASSGYAYTTTQTVSATATLGSTLTSLGVKEGYIGVTVNGIERRVKIGNDETIQSFIEKLNNIGAKASYNEETGIFNVNLGSNDIRDIDNTGIVNALHLKGVNEGYTSNTLQKPLIETITEKVSLNTKLYEIGIQSDKIQIASNTNSTPMTLSIESTWTFASFIQRLGQYGFEAELTEDGCFTLKDAVIVDPGQTQILKVFGWDTHETSYSTQTSNKLQYTSTVVEGTIADRNTLLKDFADINNGDTIVVKNSSNRTTTITLSQTSTIGDVLDKLNDAGLYANINSSGVVSISDGSIVGGTFDIAAAFNLTEQTSSSIVTSNPIYANKTIAQDVTSTANVTYTGVRDIQLTDNIVDLFPELSEAYVTLISSATGTGTTRRIEDYYTFQDLFDDLKKMKMGVDAKLENGVISLTTPEGYYVTGLEPLGIGVNSNVSSSTTTVATTRTSGTLYYTSTVTATLSDKICDFVNFNEALESLGPTTPCFSTNIYDKNGNTLDMMYVAETDTGNIVTFQDLKNKLAAKGITMTMNNGVISLSASNGEYVEGSLCEQLGIQKFQTTTNHTTGATMISSVPIQDTVDDLGRTYNPQSITGSQLQMWTTITSTTKITSTSKMSDLFSFTGGLLANTATLEIKVNKADASYIDPTVGGGSSSSSTIVQSSITTVPTKSYFVTITGDMTAQEFLTAVNDQTRGAITARIDKDGAYFSFSGNNVGESFSSVSSPELGIGITTNASNLTPTKKTSQSTLVPLTTTSGYRNLTLLQLTGKLTGIGQKINIVLIDKDGNEKEISFTTGSSTTIADINNALSSYGLAFSINSNRALTLSVNRNAGDDNWAIKEMDSYIEEALRMTGKIGEGLSYITTTKAAQPATASTSLGISSTKYITVVQNGTASSITITTNNTIGDLIGKLAEKGINASIYAGDFVISASDTSYIKSMDSELMSKLNLSGSTYNVSSETTYSNTSSKTITAQKSEVIDGSQRISSEHCGTISFNYNGKTENYYISNYMTYNEAINNLKGWGFDVSLNNGQISISSSNPNVYVTNFGGAFGLNGTGYTTKVQSGGPKYNTPSNRLQKEDTFNASWDTTLGQLGYTDTNGQIFINNKNNYSISDGQTIKVSSTDTLRDLRDKLALHNISFDLSDGQIEVKGLNGAYIYSMSTSITDALNLPAARRSSSNRTSPYFEITKELINEEDSTNILLEDLYLADGSALMNSGQFYLYVNDARYMLGVYDNDTLDLFRRKLEDCGVTTSLKNGVLTISGQGNVYITTEGIANDHYTTPAGDIGLLGLEKDRWKQLTSYQGSPIDVTNSSSQITAAQRDTKLSDLGVTTGEYLLYKDGVKHTLFISSDDTLGDFLSSIRSFGIESSLVSDGNTTTIKTNANGNTYITASNSSDKSNVIEKLFGGTNVAQSYNYSATPQIERNTTSLVNADEDTKLADITTTFIKPGYNVTVTVNNDVYNLNISNDDTVGTLLDKFNSLGLNASFADGKMVIQSGYNSLNINVTDPNGRAVDSINYFNYSSDLGGYSATDPNTPITSTEVVIETHHNSVANYADYNTKLSLLNISDGKLTLYRNGEKAEIEVNSEQTFGDLRSKIAAKFSDVNLTFENGNLKISSTKGDVVVGTTTDTSNFAAITGMSTNSAGESVSSRALYRVNSNSKIMDSGLFVRGNVTGGTFKVGDATITIDNNTTLDDIISQINYSDDSQATAYWDSIDGKFVIKSKKAGASLINIEAGTSNFTDIMGLTSTENGAKVLNTEAQELGKNAVFTINGTRFTSTSNTVDSSVSRIQGVTINLKDVSNGESVTLTIEKDKETVATAVSDIVDAYNELIENIDKEVARGANLSNESTLKLIRNQIRSLMTGSISNSGSFKNLASIGISLSAAASGNIRTDNINTLSFDKDKFMESFQADFSSVKSLLVGTENNLGILSQVEGVLEQALGGVTGYFASAEKSYSKKISNLDDKIDKANKAADRYKVRLEAKFKAMDMLISKFQNQYSSFLG